MKVFIYEKKTNKTLGVFKEVNKVETSGSKIFFTTSDTGIHTYDTKVVKTRIYQN